MSDINIKIGADTSALDAAMSKSGNTIFSSINRESAKIQVPPKPPPIPKQQTLADKINQFQGSPFASIGALFGPEGAAIGATIDALSGIFSSVTSFVKEMVSQAKEIRNLSIATGLTTKQLQSMAGMAEASGVSLSTIAHAFAEFNKRMGEMQIKGNGLNYSLARLGITEDMLNNKTVTAQNAIIALAKAYEAGTDATTLAYYGNQLFGSSFEQLLPIIKRGTAALQTYAGEQAVNSQETIVALDRAGHAWDWFWNTFKTTMMEGLGRNLMILEAFNDAAIALYSRTLIATMGAKRAGEITSRMISANATETQRLIIAGSATQGLSAEEQKQYMEGFGTGKPGNKLNPLNNPLAVGASTLQQMGGGDIVSAMAFTPLEKIADNTGKTADHLQTIVEKTEKEQPQKSYTLPLGF